LLELLKTKEQIRAIHPTSLVSFATIPTINFRKAQQFYLCQGFLKKPKYNDEQLAAFQQSLSDILDRINTRLIKENRIVQYIPLWGLCVCTQSFWHQEIEKVGRRKRKGIIHKAKHVPWNALIDGVHPNDSIADGWFVRLHEGFKKDLIRIKSSDTLPS
jgi:hypothetical protein